ncbi:MAG: tetratricopeptide repeat protein [Planctomycetes bacterium]|nr:tetratricopeptide repeat protein [Planctomycetota bacterium]
MTSGRARRLREWFEAACDLPPSEWAGFVAGCDDPSLASDVLDLLRRDRADASPLDAPALAPTQREALAALASDAPLPARIGRYEVLSVLGRGSMGTVYAARASPDAAPVAIKVLRTGLPSRALLHRFRREAELLARLDHPYIARILETGTTETGLGTLPFLVMELVSGRALDVYCSEERLDLRARLELLARVGEAVEHAHRRGVVHRDLKPANVLVDDAGDPRLLDFGVARTALAPESGASLRTSTGQLMGTLQYMGPEQTLGDPSAVDARADVYALGAVAYELLAGRPPVDVSGCALDEAVRRVRLEEAPRAGTLRPELRGPLEIVLARALEKDPLHRTASARAFADDLRAVRDGRPVAARPPSTLELVRRFARRDPRAFRVAAAFATVLVLGILGTSWGWIEARARQREADAQLGKQIAATRAADAARAESERARAGAQAALRDSEGVADFLDDMFRAVQPDELGAAITLEDALLVAAPRVDQGFADRPGLAARLHATLGRGFRAVGRPERALEHFDAAERLGALVPDADGARAMRLELGRALVSLDQGRFAEAAERLAPLVARLAGSDPELRASTTRELARAQELGGDGRSASATLQSMLDASGHVRGASLRTDEGVRLDLAHLAVLRGEPAHAETMLRDVLATRTARLGPEHVDTLEAVERLAELLAATGRAAEAEPLYARRVEALTALLGPEHPQTLYARGRLALLLTDTGRGAEALTELDALVASSRRVLGEDHPRTASLLCTRSVAAYAAGRPDAPALIEEALARGRTVLGDEHPFLVTMLNNAATLRLADGRFDEAVSLLDEALAVCRHDGSSRVLDEILVQVNLAGALLSLGRLDEARATVDAALPRSREFQGPAHPQTVTLLHYRGTILHLAGDLADAEAAYRELLGLDLPATDITVLNAVGSLGMIMLATDRVGEGTELIRATLPEVERLYGPSHQLAVVLREALASAGD